MEVTQRIFCEKKLRNVYDTPPNLLTAIFVPGYGVKCFIHGFVHVSSISRYHYHILPIRKGVQWFASVHPSRPILEPNAVSQWNQPSDVTTSLSTVWVVNQAECINDWMETVSRSNAWRGFFALFCCHWGGRWAWVYGEGLQERLWDGQGDAFWFYPQVFF